MMLLEPRQKKVAMIASPRCGFVGTNPMLRSVPLSLNVPSFWSRTTFGATTSNIGSAGPRCSELMESRQAHQLGAVLQAQLVHDAGAVGVHTLRAETQQLADFGRGMPLRGEAEDFALPHTEPGNGADPIRARLLLVLDQHPGGARVEEH